MSLILDALKKSEAERQRQTGPTLLEVRIAKPQRRYPVWALAVAALLLLNMLLLLFFVLRRPTTTAPVMSAAPVAPAPVAATASVAAPAAPTTSLPVTPAPSAPQPGTQPSSNSDSAPTLADNPADDLPAIARTPASVTPSRDEAANYSSLPSFSDVGGNLPDFRLDLHVYAERPRDRYALINMHAVHEGDSLPEGARVMAITREGVALDYRGQQFMLRPQ